MSGRATTIERRRLVKIAIFGNTFWARRLADGLAGHPVSARAVLEGQDETLPDRSLRDWLSESQLWRHDVLHVIGWPMLWNLWLAAHTRRTPVVLQWIGSDVHAFLASPRWSRVAGPVWNGFIRCHLAVSPNLADELRAVGIYARCLPLALPSIKGIDVPPLPTPPRVLVYLPEKRFAFYGGPKVLEMARADPGIRWVVVAHSGKALPPLPNVTYLGYVNDMDSVYREVSALVRLTDHDGIGTMTIEALARGRHVVWSRRAPYCRWATTAESALREVRDILRSPKPNWEGAAHVRKHYDMNAMCGSLQDLYGAIVRRDLY